MDDKGKDGGNASLSRIPLIAVWMKSGLCSWHKQLNWKMLEMRSGQKEVVKEEMWMEIQNTEN